MLTIGLFIAVIWPGAPVGWVCLVGFVCQLVVVVPVAREFAPQLVLVSAGYDAHRDDPLASGRVTEVGYAAMTGALRRLCAELDVPLGVTLEGGYELRALARSVAATLEVLGADSPPPAADLALHPLAAEAAARASRQWPALSAG